MFMIMVYHITEYWHMSNIYNIFYIFKIFLSSETVLLVLLSIKYYAFIILMRPFLHYDTVYHNQDFYLFNKINYLKKSILA